MLEGRGVVMFEGKWMRGLHGRRGALYVPFMKADHDLANHQKAEQCRARCLWVSIGMKNGNQKVIKPLLWRNHWSRCAFNGS